jgi:hypothetical protein
VLVISTFHKIKPDEFWVAFGSGTNFRYIPVHDIASRIGPRMCNTLPFFHSFTGCDTVSAFVGRGKKCAWRTWVAFPEATSAFEDMMLMRSDISHTSLAILERFTVLLYDRMNGE